MASSMNGVGKKRDCCGRFSVPGRKRGIVTPFVVPTAACVVALRADAEGSGKINEADKATSSPAASARADVVNEWEELILESSCNALAPSTMAARDIAIMHGLIYDAVDDATRNPQPYYRLTLPVPAVASFEIAAWSTVHEIPVELYPLSHAAFDAHSESSLARQIPNVET